MTHKHARKAGRAADQVAGAVLYPGKALKSGATDWREKRTNVQESATKHRTTHEHAAPTTPAQPEPASVPARPAREPAPIPAVASTNGHGPREEAARVVRPFKQDLEQHRQPAHPTRPRRSRRVRRPGREGRGNVTKVPNRREPPRHQRYRTLTPDRTPEPPRPLAAAVRQERAERAASPPSRPMTRGAKIGVAVAAAPFVGLLGLGMMFNAQLGMTQTTGGQPSQLARADIPALYYLHYRQAGDKYGIDWAVLAAIGKVETDHGRLNAPGVTQRRQQLRVLRRPHAIHGHPAPLDVGRVR